MPAYPRHALVSNDTKSSDSSTKSSSSKASQASGSSSSSSKLISDVESSSNEELYSYLYDDTDPDSDLEDESPPPSLPPISTEITSAPATKKHSHAARAQAVTLKELAYPVY